MSEKITSDKNEAKNILKKLLIFVLIGSNVKEFLCRFYNHYTKRPFTNSNSLLTYLRLSFRTPLAATELISPRMNEVYLLTGGNMGDRRQHLLQAKTEIKNRCGNLLEESSVYETAAWGNEEQEPFLNQVLKIETEQTPQELLRSVLQIEEDLGRKRALKYGPRTIDIDILFFNDQIVEQPGLSIPHPQIQKRRFVLVPLNEIAAHKVHPVLNKNMAQLLSECPDPLAVNKFS